MYYINKFLLIIALLSSSVAFGQLTEDPEERREQGKDPLKTQTPEGRPLPFSQRLRFGGGIGPVSFSNYYTAIGVSPVIAYQATEHLIIGAAVSYTYGRYKPGYIYQNQGITINQYGVRGFAMYEFIPGILPNLYLHGELQSTTYQQKVDQGGTYSGTLAAPLVGLTYMQPISRRFGVNLTALYNLNYNQNDPLSYQIYGGSPFVLRLSFF